jgi:methanogenic corrinoid protein MtbC1
MDLTEEKRQALQVQLKAVISDADEQAGVALAEAALADGITPVELFREVIQPVLQDIGDAFARLDVFLPDLMRAGLVVKAMQLEVLEPAIRNSGSENASAGTVVIGTAQGDIHDIGKNMVALMLQVNGFKVVDLGTNVSAQAFIDAARRERADIIAMSSLLTPTLPYIKDLVKRLESLEERKRYLVIAGGAPITREWTQTAGLDGFGEDAMEAVALCQGLMSRRKEPKLSPEKQRML